MVVEFTSDLIQIFILNLSIGPPYYKGGCCQLIQVLKVLQFEMKFFLEKIYLLNSSGTDDPACQQIFLYPRPDDPVCLAVPLCHRSDDPASKPETFGRLSDDPTPWPDDPALGILESFSCLNKCWVG
jgi:hypothetical protein